MMFIYFVIAVFIVYYIVKENDHSLLKKTSPEELLKARFASGEIDEETFKRMMNTLKS